MTWKLCALVGLIVPGCFQFIFGSFVVCKIKVMLKVIPRDEYYSSLSCIELCNFISITKLNETFFLKHLNNDGVEALCESPTRPIWFRLWEAFNYLTTVVNVIIFFILWTSKVTSTQINDTHELEKAARIYMICVGIELFVIVGSLALALLCCCCACASFNSSCCVEEVEDYDL